MALLKALSLSRPWTAAIEQHDKRVENCPRWAPHPHLVTRARQIVGQELALHSSGTYDKDGADFVEMLIGERYGRKDTPDKAITSVVTVSGVLLPGDRCPGGQDRWYAGSVALVLCNVRVLPQPVPMSGGLGFLTLKAEILRQIEAQL